ncbi:hypothetical protein GN244_ATG14634 [Phytophthora infestans]|uniref:Uncharacterized protein n=1 Tax=Phytophthora infestans TaxID=4787 RepID=A0A833SVZ3_PHYIN|nr:hypothetical protein GN244_ATG14634 [Phytophthora infestans]
MGGNDDCGSNFEIDVENRSSSGASSEMAATMTGRVCLVVLQAAHCEGAATLCESSADLHDAVETCRIRFKLVNEDNI